LAQDQLRNIQSMVALGHLQDVVRCAVFDGDLDKSARRNVLATANVLLCNPDVLHATLLPNHMHHSALFSELSHVVIDEAHMFVSFGVGGDSVLRLPFFN
jgi:DEAD/DEAH box helicase domain-containing protein